MRSLAISGICAALAFTGCDNLKTVANPEVPLWVHHAGTAISIAKRRELTAKSRIKGEPYERGAPELDPAHRRVFIGASDGGLYALDAADLSTIWRFETDGAVQSEPYYDPKEDVVYFGSNDSALYKLRASDGKMLWRFATNGEITRRIVLHRDTLFVVNGNDTLVAVHPDSGKLKWYRHRQPAAGLEISGYAGPAVLDDFVFAAFSDGIVMAYQVSDGAEAWLGPVDTVAAAEEGGGAEDLRYLDVDTTPVLARVGDQDLLFVASYEGGVFAYEALSGTQVWRNDAAVGVTELTLYDNPAKPRPGDTEPRRNRVLIGSSGLTGVWGLSLDKGSELWRRDLPTGGVTKAVQWGGALLIGTTRYGLFLFHPLDGGVLDGVYAGGAFAAPPAAYESRAFAITNHGTFLSLHIEPPTGGGGPPI